MVCCIIKGVYGLVIVFLNNGELFGHYMLVLWVDTQDSRLLTEELLGFSSGRE